MNKKESTGEKLKKIRLEKGLTQKDLAKLCNMYESQIRKYETSRANPKIETLQKLANALGVPVNALKSDLDLDLERIVEHTNVLFSMLEQEMKKENQLISSYRQLDEIGQEKALEYIEMLAKIPEYRKETEKVTNK